MQSAPPSADEFPGWLAAAVAMAALQAVSTVLVVGSSRQRRAAVPRGGAGLHGPSTGSATSAAGILGALVWIAAPLGLPRLLVPLVLTCYAYCGSPRTLQERSWMAEMSQTADTVVRSGDLDQLIVDDMTDMRTYMEDPASLRRAETRIEHFVAELASKAVPRLNARARVATVGERGTVRADAQRLTQAPINLITNTREHTPPGTRLSAEW